LRFKDRWFVSGHGLWPCRLCQGKLIPTPQGATNKNLEPLAVAPIGALALAKTEMAGLKAAALRRTVFLQTAPIRKFDPNQSLPWPQPSKCPGGEQTVNQPIKGLFDRHRPGLAFPDAVTQCSQTIRHEGGGSGDSKHR